MMRSMWYDPRETLSKNRLLNFDIGARGCGKTTGAIRYAVEQKLKEQTFECVWLRRYKTERREIVPTFFDSIVAKNFFPGHEFKASGKTGYLDGKPLIWFSALSVDGRVKGITSPHVKLVVFDEFLSMTRTGYLHDEVESYFLPWYDSIARPSDPNRARVPVLFLANAMSMSNPYFDYFNIRLDSKQRFMSRRLFAQVLPSVDFREQAEQSEFADLIRGTTYGEHSIENRFMLDTPAFYCKRTPSSRYIATLSGGGKTFGAWVDWMTGSAFISWQHDPTYPTAFTITREDRTPNALSIPVFRKHPVYSTLVAAYQTGRLFYDDAELETLWRSVMRACDK